MFTYLCLWSQIYKITNEVESLLQFLNGIWKYFTKGSVTERKWVVHCCCSWGWKDWTELKWRDKMSLPASFLTSQNKSIAQGQGWVSVANTILFIKGERELWVSPYVWKVLYLLCFPSLFPTMPRHNYHKVAPLVKSLCDKHGLLYVNKPMLKAFGDIVR